MIRTATATVYKYIKANVIVCATALQADCDEQSSVNSYTYALCELSMLPSVSNAEERALLIKACSKLLDTIISSVGTAICSSLAKIAHVQVREHVFTIDYTQLCCTFYLKHLSYFETCSCECSC
jgi:hypothetical protein